MRKLIMLVAALALLGLTTARPAMADDYDDSQAHPLRIIAYIVHPLGFAAEWLLTRPFHELVSQPDLEPVFGHTSHGEYGSASVEIGGETVAPTSSY
jgi:hypothetical protein